MEKRGIQGILITAVVSAVFGALCVLLVWRLPLIDSPDASEGSPSRDVRSGDKVDEGQGVSIAGGHHRKPPDRRVILSDDPARRGINPLTPGIPEAIPLDPNEPNEFAFLPKSEIHLKIKKQEEVLNRIGHARVKSISNLYHAKKHAEANDPEIVALEKDIKENKKVLRGMLESKSDVIEKNKKRTKLDEEATVLAQRRQMLASSLRAALLPSSYGEKGVKVSDSDLEAMRKEGKAIDERMPELEKERLQAATAYQSVRRHWMENDPEIKSLAAIVIEKKHLLEAKKGQAPPVLEARKQLRDLDEEYAKEAKKNSRLHKALMLQLRTFSGDGRRQEGA